MGITDPIKDVVAALNPLSKGDQPDEDTTTGPDTGLRPAQGRLAEETEQVRVPRAEEELDVNTVERETGSVGVSKSVHTDTEHVEVPVRREEVQVDRVPVGESGEAASIGAEEIRVPVYAEETVVSKRPVVKEELRIRKDVHTDLETVTEDVRKEHLDVDTDEPVRN